MLTLTNVERATYLHAFRLLEPLAIPLHVAVRPFNFPIALPVSPSRSKWRMALHIDQ